MAKRRIVVPERARDALYYASERSGASIKDARHVIIGLVSGFMACGIKYEDALRFVGRNLPADARMKAIPIEWIEDLA